MRTVAGLPRVLRPVLLTAMVATATAVLPARAFTVTNADPELRAKVSIEYWLRWVKAGESVGFRPESFPVTVYVQFPEGTLTCEATSDSDTVELTRDECVVNGVPAGRTTLRF